MIYIHVLTLLLAFSHQTNGDLRFKRQADSEITTSTAIQESVTPATRNEDTTMTTTRLRFTNSPSITNNLSNMTTTRLRFSGTSNRVTMRSFRFPFSFPFNNNFSIMHHNQNQNVAACFACNLNLLNPNLTFTDNLKQFQDSCENVDINSFQYCSLDDHCYIAKFALFTVRGCIARTICEDARKSNNNSLVPLNGGFFKPDSFTCCDGLMCNGRNHASKSFPSTVLTLSLTLLFWMIKTSFNFLYE